MEALRYTADWCHSKCLVRVPTSVASAKCMLFQGRTRLGEGEGRNKISDERLMIISAQPHLGNKSQHSSVGKGGKQRLERDGMTGCRKGWEDSRGRWGREDRIWNVWMGAKFRIGEAEV